MKLIDVNQPGKPLAKKDMRGPHPNAGAAISSLVGDFSRDALSQLPCGTLDLEKYGFRNWDNEPAFDASIEWLNDHSAQTPTGTIMIGTPKGSLILGILHNYQNDTRIKDFVDDKIIPVILKKAREVIEAGKKVVFLAEGCIGGPAGSEQALIARMLAEEFGVNMEQDTWDDATVNPLLHRENEDHLFISLDSPIVEAMTKKIRNKALIEAGIYAMLFGEGDTLDISSDAREILSAFGLDFTDKDALYKAVFPNSSEKYSVLSQIADEYNRLREENMLKKIKKIETEGKIAIVVPGASHAFALKYVFQDNFDQLFSSLEKFSEAA